MSQPLLSTAIRALERDPTHSARVRVDAELTVEVRVVEPAVAPRAADRFASSVAGKGRLPDADPAILRPNSPRLDD